MKSVNLTYYGTGSDSAPHHIDQKTSGEKTAAGCFTHPWSASLVVAALARAVKQGWIQETEVTLKVLQRFLSDNGRMFYKINHSGVQADNSDDQVAEKIEITWKGEVIPQYLSSKDGNVTVVPFRAGEKVPSTDWVCA